MNKKAILKIIKNDLREATPLRKQLDSKIAEWLAAYEGKPYGNEKKGKSRIISRDIRKQSEWQHAYLVDPFVSTPDIIRAVPITSDDYERAKQTTLVLNTQFCRQFDRFNFMSKAIKVLDQEGTCIVRTGWEYEDKTTMESVPVIGLDALGNTVINDYTEQEVVTVIINRPTAVVRRSQDVFIDPTCQGNFDDAQFVIDRFETDISSLLKDKDIKGYKNLDKLMKNQDNGDIDYESGDTTEFMFSDKARKKVVVYEYWGNLDVDGSGQTRPIVCTFVGDTIIRLQDNPYPDKKPPFLVVPFTVNPFSIYGEPNAELIGDNQKVNTAILRGFIDNMAASNNGQKGIQKNALDMVNRKKFLAGDNFEFNGSRADFFEGSYNQIPNSAFNMLTLSRNEIDSVTGIQSFSGGIDGDALGSTATAARGAIDATAARRLNLVRNIAENLVKPLLRKWTAYNSEFLESEQVMRITESEFVTIRKDDITQNIDISLEISTNEDNANKANQISFMMQTLGQTMDAPMRNMMLAEIATLYKMPRLAKQIQEHKEPEPSPQQLKMMELNIAMEEAKLRNELAKAGENEVDIELKGWKARTEEAKSRALDAKSDLADLDFIKKESNSDRQETLEDMQIQQAQKIELENNRKKV